MTEATVQTTRFPAAWLDVGTLRQRLPAIVTAIAFVALFATPIRLLFRDWWTLPEAGHGLLLGPGAVWLAWRSGIVDDAHPRRGWGLAVLGFAILMRYAGALAAELFTMRMSIVVALAGLTIYHFGFRQIIRWWLPFLLGALAVPLPELITQALALPLQFKASQMGAALLKMRSVPVLLSGNVILLPGQQLFVTEACSGLRSLTALLSLSVLLSALMLRYVPSRILLIAAAVPVAIFINGFRVFLTGFLVFFVSPELGKGFMHLTEGWLLFIVSFTTMCLLALGGGWIERTVSRRVQHA